MYLLTAKIILLSLYYGVYMHIGIKYMTAITQKMKEKIYCSKAFMFYIE